MGCVNMKASVANGAGAGTTNTTPRTATAARMPTVTTTATSVPSSPGSGSDRSDGRAGLLRHRVTVSTTEATPAVTVYNHRLSGIDDVLHHLPPAPSLSSESPRQPPRIVPFDSSSPSRGPVHSQQLSITSMMTPQGPGGSGVVLPPRSFANTDLYGNESAMSSAVQSPSQQHLVTLVSTPFTSKRFLQPQQQSTTTTAVALSQLLLQQQQQQHQQQMPLPLFSQSGSNHNFYSSRNSTQSRDEDMDEPQVRSLVTAASLDVGGNGGGGGRLTRGQSTYGSIHSDLTGRGGEMFQSLAQFGSLPDEDDPLRPPTAPVGDSGGGGVLLTIAAVRRNQAMMEVEFPQQHPEALSAVDEGRQLDAQQRRQEQPPVDPPPPPVPLLRVADHPRQSSEDHVHEASIAWDRIPSNMSLLATTQDSIPQQETQLMSGDGVDAAEGGGDEDVDQDHPSGPHDKVTHNVNHRRRSSGTAAVVMAMNRGHVNNGSYSNGRPSPSSSAPPPHVVGIGKDTATTTTYHAEVSSHSPAPPRRCHPLQHRHANNAVEHPQAVFNPLQLPLASYHRSSTLSNGVSGGVGEPSSSSFPAARTNDASSASLQSHLLVVVDHTPSF